MKSSLRFLLIAIGIVALIFIVANVMPRQIPNEVIQTPDERLTSTSTQVSEFSEETKQVANQLQNVLKKVDSRFHVFGLGMSAPQIGINQRIIAFKTSYGEYKVMVNPEIVETKWQIPFIERCFSLKGMHFTKRYLWTKVKYQDIEGNNYEEIFRGRYLIIQQEVDHLNGRLINDDAAFQY